MELVPEMAEAFSPLTDSDACRRIVAILEPYGVRRIALFGSRARGDHRPGSDLDLLVRFERAPSLLRLGELEERLGEALGMRVDLVTERSLSPYIRDTVLREARVIYG
ncbi:MAG: nucleotidyltransferase family protein [Methanoregulaceae archaeon]